MAPSLSPGLLPEAVRHISQRLAEAGHPSWLVGGSVRDSLLGQLQGSVAPGQWVAKDWDLATSARPEAVQELFPRVIPTGISHGTVTVVHRRMHVEVTTLRTESGYQDGRRPSAVTFVAAIEDDLARRDFTINAIALDPRTGSIVDPFGGLPDLHAKLIRAVGDPAQRFAEDGLRVLRAARFVSSLEFTIETKTAEAMRPSLSTYARVSAERVREEWIKALAARRPSLAFEIMRLHGLLDITAPELAVLAGHTTPLGNAWSATLRCVDRAPRDLELRLAALLARVHADPALAARAAEDLLVRLRTSNAERAAVRHLIEHQELPLKAPQGSGTLRRFLSRVTPERLGALCTLGRALAPNADAVQAIDHFQNMAEQELDRHPPLSLKELAINGQALIRAGIPAGPRLGRVLDQLLDAVLDAPELNEPERLLALARQWVEA